jgi:MFS family permease
MRVCSATPLSLEAVPSALLPIFLIVVVDILGMTIMFPLLPFYAEHLGAGPLGAGLLISVYAVCQLFGGPLLGRLSDHTGRKPLLVVSQIGTLFGLTLLAFTNTLWVVFLSRVIDGLTAGNISLAQAYIADVTKPEERTRSFAVIGIAFGVGFLIGPAVSGYLAQFGYQYPVYAAMALSATSILTTIVMLPGHKPAGNGEVERRLSILGWGSYAAYFRQPGLAPLLWQFFAYMICFSLFMSGFPLFAERRYTWEGQRFRSAGGRVRVRLYRRARHPPARRTDRAAFEDFRRFQAGAGGAGDLGGRVHRICMDIRCAQSPDRYGRTGVLDRRRSAGDH